MKLWRYAEGMDGAGVGCLHGFPVEVSGVGDTAAVGKLGEIDAVGQIFEGGEEFREGRSC